MFEKVNPSHPDKVADRIAGAIVDLAYRKEKDPKVAVEVLLAHGSAMVAIESSVDFTYKSILKIVKRISGIDDVKVSAVKQDHRLAKNQDGGMRCGDNGIFKGVPLSLEEKQLSLIARDIYAKWPSDGKYLVDGNRFVICQSKAASADLKNRYPGAIVNPIGDWEGGTDVDAGATNRKIGSDMARGATGGGLHGKDLSKADVSVNIHAYLKAQRTGKPVEISCAIGDETVDGLPYSDIVDEAKGFVARLGGFEKLAEWGLF